MLPLSHSLITFQINMKENHTRSVLKGITWRVIATADTIFLAWLITGDIKSALKIGFTEVLTKVFLFYLHERVWTKLKFWRNQTVQADGTIVIKDSHHRSLVKGISWRFFGTMDTIIISIIFTGDYTKAFSIGFAELFTKVGLYYLHERVWHNIKFGIIPATAEASPVAQEVESEEEPAF